MSESRESRAHRRVDVSIAARLTHDGQAYRTGFVTSLGDGGAFFQTSELLPARARVLLELALDGGGECVRVRATVAYVNRRSGTVVVPGLGLRFEEVGEPEAQAIAATVTGPRVAFALDEYGGLVWPVVEADGPNGPAPDAAGLAVIAQGGWEPVAIGPEGGVEGGDPDRDASLDVFRQWASAAVTSLLDEGVDPVGLAFRGFPLAPAAPVARETLAAHREGAAERIALQSALLSILLDVGRQPETISDAQGEWLADLVEALRAASTTADASMRGEELGEIQSFASGLADLHRGWVALRDPAACRVHRDRLEDDQSWLVGASEAPVARAGAPRPQRRSSRRPKASARAALTVGIPAVVILASIGYVATSWTTATRTDPREAIGASEFADLFALESIRLQGESFEAIVEDWGTHTHEEQGERLDAFCARLSARGIRAARLIDESAKPVARCGAGGGVFE